MKSKSSNKNKEIGSGMALRQISTITLADFGGPWTEGKGIRNDDPFNISHHAIVSYPSQFLLSAIRQTRHCDEVIENTKFLFCVSDGLC